MTQQVLKKELTVQNRSGVHARPCTMIVQQCQRFRAELRLCRAGVTADCRSMLDLLSLGACNGTVLTLEANGEDAEEASRAIEGLFDNRFNEDDESVAYNA